MMFSLLLLVSISGVMATKLECTRRSSIAPCGSTSYSVMCDFSYQTCKYDIKYKPYCAEREKTDPLMCYETESTSCSCNHDEKGYPSCSCTEKSKLLRIKIFTYLGVALGATASVAAIVFLVMKVRARLRKIQQKREEEEEKNPQPPSYQDALKLAGERDLEK